MESQRVQKLLQQVRRQNVSRRYHEQEIGVFVGTCPISAPGGPLQILSEETNELLETECGTHSVPIIGAGSPFLCSKKSLHSAAGCPLAMQRTIRC